MIAGMTWGGSLTLLPFLPMRSFPRFLTMLTLVSMTTIALPAAGLAQRNNPRNNPNNNNNADPSATPTGTVAPTQNGFWRCEMPGGVYLVALRNIQSISSHEYIVDGAARVTEVTIATSSSVEGRFYYLEPVTPSAAGATLQQLQQHVKDLASSHLDDNDKVWEKVIKNYPTTTHAHTVEYRLTSKENLQQLYSSLEQAWMSGRGAALQTQ